MLCCLLFRLSFLVAGEHGQPEGRDAEGAEGPQHQGLLLLHPGD